MLQRGKTKAAGVGECFARGSGSLLPLSILSQNSEMHVVSVL